MSNNQQKIDFQSLSSLSMEHNLKELGASNLFNNAARKSSFDFVNVFKDSAQFDRKQLKNSLQLLSSNIVFDPKNFVPTRQILKYNQRQKSKIEEAGTKPIEIGQVVSESQQDVKLQQLEQQSQQQSLDSQFLLQTYKPTNYLPPQLQKILRDKQIPLEYVKGLLLVRDNAEVKSVRRLKVQRYLQKRRNKTWNRKICYNCRQKVAEQRLRIKGKFIKKRRAMEFLGLTKPIPMAQLKRMLQIQLKDKTHAQIQILLRKK